MKKAHTFHIPVMGTCFTIDSPLKVAKYGISSVISLVDDTLIENMRKYYCQKTGEPYQPITKKDADFRAKRITAYLDLVDKIVQQQFTELKASAFEIGTEITKYFELLPASSPLKLLYNLMLKTNDPDDKAKMQNKLRDAMVLSGGEWTYLFSSPISTGLLIAAVLGFIAPMFLRRYITKPQRVSD